MEGGLVSQRKMILKIENMGVHVPKWSELSFQFLGIRQTNSEKREVISPKLDITHSCVQEI